MQFSIFQFQGESRDLFITFFLNNYSHHFFYIHIFLKAIIFKYLNRYFELDHEQLYIFQVIYFEFELFIFKTLKRESTALSADKNLIGTWKSRNVYRIIQGSESD